MLRQPSIMDYKNGMGPQKYGIGGDVGKYLGGLAGDWLGGLLGFRKGGKVAKKKAPKKKAKGKKK